MNADLDDGRAKAGAISNCTPATAARELTATELAFTVSEADLAAAGVAAGNGATEWPGQERALGALELAMSVRNPGFNVYVCGLSGTHREEELAELLHRFSVGQPTPGDRVLVQNFRNRDRPRALYLPAGWGARLRQDMRDLVEELRQVLPRTFRAETFEEEKEKLSEQFGEQGEAIGRQLGEHAQKAGFVIGPGPGGGIVYVPLKDGRPMEPAEMEKQTEAEQADLRKRQRELSREVKALLRQQHTLVGRLAREVKAVERRVADEVITPLVDELKERYPADGAQQYFEEVHQHILDNLDAFQEQPPQAQQAPPFMMPWMATEEDFRLDYQVNLLVDNSESKGAPVVIEPSPTYRNLFGAVERMVDRYGKLVTTFTRVTAGSLLRAHGGCLIVNVLDALQEPLVWRSLKRTLKAARLEIEAYDPFALFTTATLKPEPMEIETRVVLIGPTDVFQLLFHLDEEFHEIFKVRADFGFETDGVAGRAAFATRIAKLAAVEKLPRFNVGAMARLIEHAARSVGDRRKLPSQFDETADLMRECAYWARKASREEVEESDVRQALEQRRFRLDRIEEKVRELIRDQVLLVDIDGSRVGQVNGLAVVDIGGYGFGRPSRITASVSVGAQGVIAVDREARMSGKTYNKAILIVSGYLRQQYAQEFPLTLSASLSFEQSYSGIDGDSASVAELAALISSLSGVPIRQDLAVTGSVNQFGDVQPIGGVNEKVEGFFYTCRELGLTGRQGVVIPVQNVDNLVVAPEVLAAVESGQFHIYPVKTLNEALEVLTTIKAGRVDEDGTIHQLTMARLKRMATSLKHFASPAGHSDGSNGDDGV